MNNKKLLRHLLLGAFFLIVVFLLWRMFFQNAYAEWKLQKSIAKLTSTELIIDVKHLNGLKEENPALFALGKELFFSKTLSGGYDMACASCHHPYLAGGDGLSLPVGEAAYEPNLLGPGRWHNWKASKDPKSYGAPNIPRHSPTTFNSALYNRAMFYDGRVFVTDEAVKPMGQGQQYRTPDSRLAVVDPNASGDLLEVQARFPVTSSHEMRGFTFANNMSSREIREVIVKRLRGEGHLSNYNHWLAWFRVAFSQPDASAEEIITFANMQKALAYYEKTQTFIDNPWFAYLKGDTSALTTEQKKGAALFLTPKNQGGAGCAACHSLPSFTDEKYYNIAVPQYGRGKKFNRQDNGRRDVTQRDEDRYKFRTPNLFNVAQTAPYMHSGAYYSLFDAVKHHVDPVKSIKKFDYSFANNPQLRHAAKLYYKDKGLVDDIVAYFERYSIDKTPININDHDIQAIVAFLHSLTDPCLLNKQCLASWVPDKNLLAPDEYRLVAEFSDFSAPDKPLKQGRNLDGDTKYPSEKKPKANALGELVVSYCAKNDTAANTGENKLVETAALKGLQAKHFIDEKLNTPATFQQLAYVGALAVGDIDSDCWPDIYFATSPNTSPKLFKNIKGQFSDVAKQWGLVDSEITAGATFVDIEGNGLPDLVTTKVNHPAVQSISEKYDEDEAAITIYRNREGQFKPWFDHGIWSIFSSWGISAGDVNGDGLMDLYTTHWQRRNAKTNHLWLQSDNGTFKAANNEVGLESLFVDNNDWTWTGLLADITGNGYLDILQTSDFEESQLFVNDDVNGFINATDLHQITDENGMGAVLLDYDNDGDLDWFVTSIYDPRDIPRAADWGGSGNKLYNNNKGVFEDVSTLASIEKGGWGWGACAADFNNDGWADIFHVNGYGYEDIRESLILHVLDFKDDAFDVLAMFINTNSRLFINNQQGGFSEQAIKWGVDDTLQGRAAICFDYDRDGDVDILVSNNNGPLLMYENQKGVSDKAGFINISLRGRGNNTQGAGAKVYVTAGGLTQVKSMQVGGGFVSGGLAELHFGLGDAKIIDKIQVVWPQPYFEKQEYINVAINDFVLIKQRK